LPIPGQIAAPQAFVFRGQLPRLRADADRVTFTSRQYAVPSLRSGRPRETSHSAGGGVGVPCPHWREQPCECTALTTQLCSLRPAAAATPQKIYPLPQLGAISRSRVAHASIAARHPLRSQPRNVPRESTRQSRARSDATVATNVRRCVTIAATVRTCSQGNTHHESPRPKSRAPTPTTSQHTRTLLDSACCSDRNVLVRTTTPECSCVVQRRLSQPRCRATYSIKFIRPVREHQQDLARNCPGSISVIERRLVNAHHAQCCPATIWRHCMCVSCRLRCCPDPQHYAIVTSCASRRCTRVNRRIGLTGLWLSRSVDPRGTDSDSHERSCTCRDDVAEYAIRTSVRIGPHGSVSRLTVHRRSTLLLVQAWPTPGY